MSWFDTFATKLAKQVIRFRWLVVVVAALVVGFVASGAQNLQFATNYRVFFSKENPQLTAFEDFQSIYTKSDFITFVVKEKTGDVFNPRTLQALQELTEASWQIPFNNRVDSITNFQHTEAEEDDLIVADLVEDNPHTLTSQELDKVRQTALSEPTLVKRLVSDNGQTTGVNVTLQFPQKDPYEVIVAMTKAREIFDAFKEKYPHLETALSGTTPMNAAFMEASMNDMQTLVPLMYLVLLITMALLLRSVFGTAATLVVIAFSAASGMGIAGWMGFPLTPPSATAPTIILTLAIADSMHILLTMFKEMSRGRSKHDAIIESLRINLQPVFLTSVTTAIGFLSLNFSDAPPFRHLGNMTAAGVIAAFFLSVTLLPALVSILPIKRHEMPEEKKGLVHNLGDWVVKSRKILLPTMLGIVVVTGLAIPKLELNDEFVKYFSKDIEFRRSTDFMNEHLTGIYQAEYSLGAKDAGGIQDPLYLANLEKFSNWLKGQPEVVHVYSMGDIFKRLNKNMHGDDAAYYKLPTDRELAAQYLLLYEMSLPYGLDLNDRINVDKSATRLTATFKDISTVEIRAFKDRSEQWLRDNTPSYMHTEATSPVVMFSYISQRNIESMMSGNALAFALISLIIAIALKSVRMGAISLIPNLVPSVMAFGIWAVFVGQVDMSVAIMTACGLGIIVDDTVHFLSKYHRARNEKGYGARDSVRYAFDTVGMALIVTTVILVAGFGIMAFSDFGINKTMGMLTALLILCALIADFLLLPPLLMALDKKKSENSKKGANDAA